MSDTEINPVQPNTIGYWEERTVNIGDYESIKFGLSITVKSVAKINNVDRKVTIREAKYVNLYPNEVQEEVVERVVKDVRKVLDDREFEVRQAVADFVDHPNIHKVKTLLNVTFENEEKIEEEDLPVTKKEKIKENLSLSSAKKNKKFKNDLIDDEIEFDFDED